MTLAPLLTKTHTRRKDKAARFAAKWKLIQWLYRRGWEEQRIKLQQLRWFSQSLGVERPPCHQAVYFFVVATGCIGNTITR
ncbi:hypothetical protein ACCAA_990008 [Candidatus Accumulibacter aalborgensis]|uniref:Uncharacterized protein n=1 Tax=Candidatus Accumulibacter aalborgensis TaxID=1860102 RepID=A0A1A8XZF5_9PROT|nr:hypothetical protein [Candidatus Accumulibacter aalborgensis]SBT10319.1 hypothetical protein ACCAA_990008 [Candidatus Accumulibacter aalborgensis]